MTIIFLAESLKQIDGWSRYSYDVIQQIKDKSIVAVFCAEITPGLTDTKQFPVLKKPFFYYNPISVFIDFLKIKELISKEFNEEDLIIHATVEFYGLLLPLLKRLKNVKRTLLTIHGTYSTLLLKNFKIGWLNRWMYKSVDRIISVSNFTKNHLLQEAAFVKPARIIVVTNGLHFQEHDIHKLDDEIFTIISVGEIKPRKGQLNLIEVAYVLLKKYYFDFKVIFIGKYNPADEYFQLLQRKIKEYNLSDLVEFKGQVNQQELERNYQRADLFTLLSINENGYYEGYPLSFHEAAMWGMPTLGSLNCGAEDAIINNQTGFLVNPYDYQLVAEKIYQLASGQISIDSEACQNWAKTNDWSKKNLMAMYNFIF